MSLVLNGTGGVIFNDLSSMSSAAQAATAWVNFNGFGVVAIRDSFNVSSITANSAGNYDLNFATAMANANYCVISTSGDAGRTSWVAINRQAADSTTKCGLGFFSGIFGSTDTVYANACVFGGL